MVPLSQRTAQAHLLYSFFRTGAGLFIALILLFLFPGCTGKQKDFLSPSEKAWLESRKGKLEILFGYESPPNAFYNERGEYVGLLVDYLNELETLLNFSFTLREFKTWKGLMDHASTGKDFIIVGIAPTSDRSHYLLFTDTFLQIPYVIVTRTSSSVSSLNDFADEEVCAVSGYAINDYIKEHFPSVRLKGVIDNKDGLRQTSTGGCQAMVINQMYASHIISEQGLTNLKIAGESGYLNKLAAATSTSDPELFQILDKAVNRIEPDRHQQLYSRWVVTGTGSIPRKVVYGAATTAAVVLFAMAILWLWSMSLRREVLKQTKKLRSERQQFRTVIAKAPIPMMLVDEEQAITLLNDTFIHQFGYDRKSSPTLGKFVHKAFPTRNREDILLQFSPEENEGIKELDMIAEDLSLRRIELTVSPLPNKVRLITMRDLTSQKKAEKEREVLQAQLNQAQKIESIGQLAGGVAHDFNNMLSVILGHAEMAMLQLDSSKATYHNISEIHKAASRSADITKKLLAFARQQAVQPEFLELNGKISGMYSMLKRLLGEDITLHLQPGDNLWPLMLDPTQLDQILINLCVNARAAIEGTGTIIIETENVTVERDFLEKSGEDLKPGGYVKMSVSDTGCGMDKETINRIFDPFFTTKPIGEGTGMGLATVYGAVKQNKGFIIVYSDPGTGTSFHVYFPRYYEQGERYESLVEPSRILKTGNETILLVEDEAMLLEMTGAILRDLGYHTLTANSPEEAIALLHVEKNIDLLITDVIMPEMNGRELARKIQAEQAGIRCIYISGYTSNIIAVQGVIDEGLHFLQKPFSRQDLADKIREVLDNTKNERE